MDQHGKLQQSVEYVGGLGRRKTGVAKTETTTNTTGSSEQARNSVKVMRKIILVIFGVFSGAYNASAIECQTTTGGGTSHWAWRLIDGRQCWYKGERGIDKSLLQWSSSDSGAASIEATVDKPRTEATAALPEKQPIQSDLLRMLPNLPLHPSFEDRWRLR
jgi:hypothetical protein